MNAHNAIEAPQSRSGDHTTINRQIESDVWGFWMFLMSDAVVFALLFATYGTLLKGTAGGPTPASEFKIGSVLLQTLILLSSSFTFGMASINIKYRPQKPVSRQFLSWMAATLALGVVFLCLEMRDFAGMFREGAFPSRSGVLSGFFALVPLHGIHVMAGCLWIIVMVIQACALGFDARVRLNVLRLGLFWHFLDIIWIAIFSVVYLQGIIR